MTAISKHPKNTLTNLINKTMTQTEQIRKHLESGKSINPLQALDNYGCFRLASRVNDLRKAGLKIKTEMVTRNDKTFAEYKLGA